MVYIALAISVLIIALGALGVASPARLLRILHVYEKPGGLYAAGATRVVLGVALFLVAPESRSPELIRVFGVVAVVAGLLTPALGPARIGRLVEWWSARPSGVFRAWAAFASALGFFLVWAVAPQ